MTELRQLVKSSKKLIGYLLKNPEDFAIMFDGMDEVLPGSTDFLKDFITDALNETEHTHDE